jgi:hypothetical protein
MASAGVFSLGASMGQFAGKFAAPYNQYANLMCLALMGAGGLGLLFVLGASFVRPDAPAS